MLTREKKRTSVWRLSINGKIEKADCEKRSERRGIGEDKMMMLVNDVID